MKTSPPPPRIVGKTGKWTRPRASERGAVGMDRGGLLGSRAAGAGLAGAPATGWPEAGGAEYSVKWTALKAAYSPRANVTSFRSTSPGVRRGEGARGSDVPWRHRPPADTSRGVARSDAPLRRASARPPTTPPPRFRKGLIPGTAAILAPLNTFSFP